MNAKNKILLLLQQEAAEITKFFSILDLNQYSDPELPSWNVLQILHHCALVEEKSLMYVKYKIEQGSAFRNFTIFDKIRFFFVKKLLDNTPKLNAPAKVLPPEDRHCLNKDHILQKWIQVNNDVQVFIQNLPEEYLSKAIYKHPAGIFSLHYMILILKYHFLRHQKQIYKLKK